MISDSLQALGVQPATTSGAPSGNVPSALANLGVQTSQNTSTTTPAATPNAASGSILSSLENAGTGVLKGIGTTLEGAGTVGQTVANQTGGRLADLLSGKGFTPTQGGMIKNLPDTDMYTPGSTTQQSITSALAPQGTAQNVGFGAEKIGEGAAALAATGNPETLLGNAGQMGAISAVQGGLQSLGQGNSLMDAAKNSFYSGLVGAVSGAAGKFAQNSLASAAEKGPAAIYNNVLNVMQRVKEAGRSPATFLANQGVWGSLGSMSRQIAEGLQEEGGNIAAKVATVAGGTSWAEIKQGAVKALQSKFGDLYSVPQIEAMIENVPAASLKNAEGDVPWAQANNVRQQLGKLIGDSKWLQSTPTEATAAAQAVYRSLAKTIQDGTGTHEEFGRLAQWMQSNKAITRALMQEDKKWLPGFYDWAAGALGALGGATSGDGLHTAGAALGSVVLERASRSPRLLTGAAQFMPHLAGPFSNALQQGARATVGGLVPTLMGANQNPPPPAVSPMPSVPNSPRP